MFDNNLLNYSTSELVLHLILAFSGILGIANYIRSHYTLLNNATIYIMIWFTTPSYIAAYVYSTILIQFCDYLHSFIISD